jgi:hypothetical protein
VYDIVARRGKRMSPVNEHLGGTPFRTSIFVPDPSDPARDLVLYCPYPTPVQFFAYSYVHNEVWAVSLLNRDGKPLAGTSDAFTKSGPSGLYSPLSLAYDDVNHVIGIVGGGSGYPGVAVTDVYEMKLTFPKGFPNVPALIVRRYADALPESRFGPVIFDRKNQVFAAIGGIGGNIDHRVVRNSIVTWNAATHALGNVTMQNAIPPMNARDDGGSISDVFYHGGAIYDPITQLVIIRHQTDPWKIYGFKIP